MIFFLTHLVSMKLGKTFPNQCYHRLFFKIPSSRSWGVDHSQGTSDVVLVEVQNILCKAKIIVDVAVHSFSSWSHCKTKINPVHCTIQLSGSPNLYGTLTYFPNTTHARVVSMKVVGSRRDKNDFRMIGQKKSSPKGVVTTQDFSPFWNLGGGFKFHIFLFSAPKIG